MRLRNHYTTGPTCPTSAVRRPRSQLSQDRLVGCSGCVHGDRRESGAHTRRVLTRVLG